MNHIGRFGLLLGIVFFASGIQPLWADTTNIDINIGYGSGGGYSYSGIHAATRCGSNNLCMGHEAIFNTVNILDLRPGQGHYLRSREVQEPR